MLSNSVEDLESEMSGIVSSLNASSDLFVASHKTASYLNSRTKHIQTLQDRVSRLSEVSFWNKSNCVRIKKHFKRIICLLKLWHLKNIKRFMKTFVTVTFAPKNFVVSTNVCIFKGCSHCQSNEKELEELKSQMSEAKKSTRLAREEARKERLEAAKLKQQLALLQVSHHLITLLRTTLCDKFNAWSYINVLALRFEDSWSNPFAGKHANNISF